MASERYEYRVRWRREGRNRTSVIRQTEAGAREKADRVLALEEVKPDTTFEDMPDLDESPVIERRAVGEWEPAPAQVTQPTPKTVEGLREWASSGHSGDVPF